MMRIPAFLQNPSRFSALLFRLAFMATLASAAFSCGIRTRALNSLNQGIGGGGGEPAASRFPALLQLGQLNVPTATGGNEEAGGIAVDPESGDLIVAGNTNVDFLEANNTFNTRDLVLFRISSDGDFRWKTQYGAVTMPGVSGGAIPRGVALDSSGNIYVAGDAIGTFGETGGGNYDIFLAKFSADGNLIWRKQLGDTTMGAAADYADLVHGIAIGPNDEIYVVGSTTGDLFETNGAPGHGILDRDAYVARFDTDGILVWSRQWGSVSAPMSASSADEAKAVKVDSTGNIVVAGDTQSSLVEAKGGGNRNAWAAKWTSAGALVWAKQVGPGTVAAAGQESINALDLDSSGNLVLAGSTVNSFADTNCGGADLLVIRITSAGAYSSATQLGTTAIGSGDQCAGYEWANDVAVRTDGGLWLAGVADSDFAEKKAGGSGDLIFVHLDASGGIVGAKQYGLLSGGVAETGDLAAFTYEEVKRATLHPNGGLYFVGQTSGSLGDILIDNTGSDMFIGRIASLPAWSPLPAPSPAVGFPLVLQLGQTYAPTATQSEGNGPIAIDPGTGDIVAAGFTTGSLYETTGQVGWRDLVVTRISSTGTVQWAIQLGDDTLPGVPSHISPAGIGIDGSGNIYVAGTAHGVDWAETSGNSSDDVFLVKLNSSGSIVWRKQLGATTLGADADGYESVYDLAVTSAGDCYVVGNTDGSLFEANGGSYDAFLAKFDSNGNLVWGKQLGGVTVTGDPSWDDYATRVKVDGSGNVVVAGYTYGGALFEANPNGFADAWAMKWTSAGAFTWGRQIGATTYAPADLSDEYVYGLDLDASGGVYLAGTAEFTDFADTSCGSGTSIDVIVIRLTSAGAFTGASQLGSTTVGSNYRCAATESVRDIRIASDGSQWIFGTTTGSFGGPRAGNQDLFVARLDASGTYLGGRQVGALSYGTTATTGNEYAGRGALHPNGSFYFTGTTDGTVSEPNAGGTDMLFGRFVW